MVVGYFESNDELPLLGLWPKGVGASPLALLSQEGSVIETQSRSREGRFRHNTLKHVALEPPLA